MALSLTAPDVVRVFATNCAHTYKLAQNRRQNVIENWQFGMKLTNEHIWDTFVLLALLKDHETQNTKLSLPHTGNQKDRLTQQMTNRNERIIHKGQPEILHYCDKCMQTYRSENGSILKVEAVVTDGLTIGHLCCSVAACPIPLDNNQRRFCPTHISLQKVCAVDGCSSPMLEHTTTVDGKTHTTMFKTCSDPDHQQMERLNKEQSKANFQLMQKLMRQNVAHPNDALVENRDLVDLEDAEEWFEVDDLKTQKDGR